MHQKTLGGAGEGGGASQSAAVFKQLLHHTKHPVFFTLLEEVSL